MLTGAALTAAGRSLPYIGPPLKYRLIDCLSSADCQLFRHTPYPDANARPQQLKNYSFSFPTIVSNERDLVVSSELRIRRWARRVKLRIESKWHPVCAARAESFESVDARLTVSCNEIEYRNSRESKRMAVQHGVRPYQNQLAARQRRLDLGESAGKHTAGAEHGHQSRTCFDDGNQKFTVGFGNPGLGWPELIKVGADPPCSGKTSDRAWHVPTADFQSEMSEGSCI